MNIFILDYDVEKCAQYHADKHVIKMILESAQMLSTAVRFCGIDEGYKATHQNHPCSIWVRKSLYNYLWLRDLIYYLNEEYKYRFFHSKNHKSFDVAWALPIPPLPSKVKTQTVFAQAMPDQYQKPCAVDAYRAYYQGEKQHLFSWTRRGKPDWLEA